MKQKNKIKKVISFVVVTMAFCSNVLNVSAVRETITIPALNNGEKNCEDMRSGDNSYVTVNCHAVYPTGQYTEDNFTKMRVKIRCANSENHLQGMSNEVILEEGTGPQNIDIFDSMQAKRKIYFCFYGNSENYSAKADVTYNAR